MITSLVRIIRFGFQNFVRNGLLSVATVAIVSLTLIMILSLVFFDKISATAIQSLQDKIDISVYFKLETADEDILELERRLSALEEVKSVEFVSREKALATFKERHADDAEITQALEELGDNPLLASLNIKATDPDKFKVIAAYLENEAFTDLIDRVTYSENRLAIERLSRFIRTFQSVGFGITIVLSLIAVLITFNTVRLAIYSNREELSVMRLVGAANSFINGPYVVDGILYGAIAAIVSILIAIPAIHFADPKILALIPEMNLKSYFYGGLAKLLLFQLGIGAALGAFSSIIAVRKYLKI